MTVLDFETSRRLIDTYNQSKYRGRPNLELDRDGYRMFAAALPSAQLSEVVDLVRFIGKDYGGAQARAVPGGLEPECLRIAQSLLPNFGAVLELVRGQSSLAERIPNELAIGQALRPFNATKVWLVWASKFYHFLNPAAFPILDSRAEASLGFRRTGSAVADYIAFCACIQSVIRMNVDVLNRLSQHDPDSPSDLKVLDKILYEDGAPRKVPVPRQSITEASSRILVDAPADDAPTRESLAAGVGTSVPTWITNIASHAERARAGDRYELCISKEYQHLFPRHEDQFELVVDGITWRIPIGKRDRVRHLYAMTECTDPGQRTKKVTELLRSAGLGPGDRPTLRHVGQYRFELQR